MESSPRQPRDFSLGLRHCSPRRRRRPTGAWSASCLGGNKRPGPGPAHRCFRAAQQPAMFVKVGTRPGGTMSGILYAKCYR